MKPQLLFLICFLTSTLFAQHPSTSSFDPNATPGTNYTDTSAEAGHWLNLLDQKQYGAAWLDGGGMMKDIISQQEWIGAMHFVREPLGNVLSRHLQSNEETAMLPYGTRGVFMILSYRTQFSGSRYGLEKVTLQRNSNNLWRVISYTVRVSNGPAYSTYDDMMPNRYR